MRNLMVDEKKKSTIANLHRDSDLSVEAIAQQVDMDVNTVQQIIDILTREDVVQVMIEQSITNVEKIMSPVVVSLDCSKTPREAAALMAKNKVGSIIVTRSGKPFGIVSQSDIVRWAGKGSKLLDSKLKGIASVPLITVGRGTSVEQAAKIMITNKIHKLPVVDGDKLLGVVTITDLAMFLSPSKRPGLALSVLQAISRRTK